MLDETGCDAVMVGRASMTNPLVFKWINAYLETGILTPEPSTRERIELARRHARLVVDHYGPGGVIRMRKWLAWYVKGFRGAAELRSRLVYIESLEEIDHIFDEYLRLSSSSSDDHAPDAGDDRMGLPPL